MLCFHPHCLLHQTGTQYHPIVQQPDCTYTQHHSRCGLAWPQCYSLISYLVQGGVPPIFFSSQGPNSIFSSPAAMSSLVLQLPISVPFPSSILPRGFSQLDDPLPITLKAVGVALKRKTMPGQPGRLVCWFRNILMGVSMSGLLVSTYTVMYLPAQRPLDASPWLRHTGSVSPRTPPVPPNLPNGPAHRLENNYYCSRDLRRSVAPPLVASTAKQIAAGGDQLSRYVVWHVQPSLARTDPYLLQGSARVKLCATPFTLGKGV